MNILDKMSHFLVSKIEFVESVSHSWDHIELVCVGYAQTPGGGETVVYSLELPEEIIYLLEHNHHFVRENC